MAEWRAILTKVAQRKGNVASIYEHAAPLRIAPGKLVLGMEQGSFLWQQAHNAEALGLVAAVASAHFGSPTEIAFDESAGTDVTTLAQHNKLERDARHEEAIRRVAEHPAVREAIREFDAELRDVRLVSE